MQAAPVRSRRWLSLSLLLLVCGGLLTLLVRQRQDIAQEQHQQSVQRAAQHLTAAPEDPLAPITPEEWLQLKEYDDAAKLDQRLQRWTAEAQAAEAKFRKAFGQSGRTSVMVRSDSRAITSAEWETQYRQFFQRDLDAYLAATKDAPPVRAMGEAFLKAAFFDEHPTVKPVTQELLAELAEQVLRDSHDPLLRAHALFRIAPHETSRELSRRIEAEVLEGLKSLTAQSPPQAELMLRAVLQQRGDADSQFRANRSTRLNQAVVRWLKAESSQTQWHRHTYRRLIDMVHGDHRRQLLGMAAKESGIDPFHMHLLAGDYYLATAWRERGGDYAHQVKPEQWEKFRANSQLAMTHLRYAWFLHPEYPVAAQLMMQATLGNEDDGRTTADWFEKTLAAQFDYLPAYGTYTLSLLPRWGGSEQALIAFGQECVASDRFDTAVPYLLLNVIDMLEDMEQHPAETLFAAFPQLEPALDVFCKQRAAWMREIAGLQTPFKSRLFPDDVIRIYLANLRPEKARQLALTLPSDYRPQQLSRNLRPGGYELAKLKAETEAVRDQIESLDRRLRGERPSAWSADDDAQLADDLKALKERADDPAAQPFLQHLEAMAEQRRTLVRGDWVALLEGPDAPGWEFFASAAEFDPATRLWTLPNDGGYGSPVLGRPLVGLAPPLEIEAEISLPDSARVREFGTVRGIAWASPERLKADRPLDPKERPELTMFGLLANRGTIQATFPRGCILAVRGDLRTEAATFKLRLRLWEAAFEYSVGEMAHYGQLCAPLDPQGLLVFGEELRPSRQRDDGAVRIGQVRLRRLELEPAPTWEQPVEQRLAYWQRRWDADPQDYLALRELARAKCSTEPAAALALARQLQAERPRFSGVHCTLGMAFLKTEAWEEAERVLKLADNETPYEWLVNVGMVELCLARPEPTPQMYQFAEHYARNLIGEGEPCVAKSLQARLAFAQGRHRDAVSLNQAALELATDASRPELEARQAEFEAALGEAQP